MKNIIAKLSIHGLPVVFDVASYDEGRIKAFVNGEQKVVSIDYYNMAKPLPEEELANTVAAYSKAMNTPIEEIHLRARLPKGYALAKEQLNSAHPVVPAKAPLKLPVWENIGDAIKANDSNTAIGDKMRQAAEQSAQANAASASRQKRKNKRVDAAKKRYEADVAATNAINATNAIAKAESPAPQAERSQHIMSTEEFSNRIAKAVANAVAEALKDVEKHAV